MNTTVLDKIRRSFSDSKHMPSTIRIWKRQKSQIQNQQQDAQSNIKAASDE